MGIEIYKNRLADISERLDKIDGGKMAGVIAEALTERGEEIAKQQYGGTHITVESTSVSNGKSQIIAKGKGIAYMEFGTGLTGQGTYQGKLPDRTLTFESPKGIKQTTQGWVYNYPNKYTKPQGLGGWFFGATFTTGQVARAQMFNTGRQLHKEYIGIAKSALKGEEK